MTIETCAPAPIHETIHAAGQAAPGDGLVAEPGVGLVSHRHRDQTGQTIHMHRRSRKASLRVGRLRPHAIEDICWSHRGVSFLLCHCGARFESAVEPGDVGDNPSHLRLQAEYVKHRAAAGEPTVRQGFVAWGRL